jgi:hypothetical protein
MKHVLMIGAATLALGAAAPAFAQVVSETTTVTPSGQTQTTVVEKRPSGAAGGAVAGAAAGAVVAGPVGAVVGGVAGAVVGNSVAPPTEVRTYVTGQTVASVSYPGEVVVGQPISGEVVWYEVPRYTKYRWAYLNGRRVVVDASNHAVVAVY